MLFVVKAGLVVPQGMSTLRTAGSSSNEALKSCFTGFYSIRIDADFFLPF